MSSKRTPPVRCSGTLHKVHKGESLFSIAKAYGISLQAIIDANPQIKDPHSISIGQLICIPRARTVVFTTGPLATDPTGQRFVGVIVENNTSHKVEVAILLFNKDTCPKTLTAKLEKTLPPGCLFSPFFDLPAFFYEVQIEAPDMPGILAAVYGLADDFGIAAGNTLRHSDLIVLYNSQNAGEIPAKQAGSAADIPASTGQWVKGN